MIISSLRSGQDLPSFLTEFSEPFGFWDCRKGTVWSFLTGHLKLEHLTLARYSAASRVTLNFLQRRWGGVGGGGEKD